MSCGKLGAAFDFEVRAQFAQVFVIGVALQLYFSLLVGHGLFRAAGFLHAPLSSRASFSWRGCFVLGAEATAFLFRFNRGVHVVSPDRAAVVTLIALVRRNIKAILHRLD